MSYDSIIRALRIFIRACLFQSVEYRIFGLSLSDEVLDRFLFCIVKPSIRAIEADMEQDI